MGTWTSSTQVGGRRTRASLIVAAALSLVAGLLAFSTPEAAAGTNLRLLKGSNVISGTTTSGMSVVLPRDSSVDVDNLGRYVGLTGGGRMSGLILTGSDLKDASRPFLAVLRAGFCGAPGCTPKKSQRAGFGFFKGSSSSSGYLTLPAGEYQLYLVADGAPVRATLELPGLRGRARLTPSRSVVSSITEPALGVGEGPGGTFYSGGESYDVKGLEGFSFNALRLKAEAWGAGEVAHCIYDEAPPEPVAFAPGCPAGQNFPITDAVVTTIPYTRVYGSGVARNGAGPMGHGVWYAAAAAVTEAADLSFFIDFAPLR